MKMSFKISRYVNIWHCDENGVHGELLMEAQMSPNICEGKNLIVRSVEPTPKEVDLGLVLEGCCYTKGKSVNVRTDKGWWIVSCNDNLTWTLDDTFCDVWD
jgi:hypothetical protein